MQVSTIAQMAVLKPVRPADAVGEIGGDIQGDLCVVNTHLFFHPRAPHIRSLHMAAILGEAAALVAEAAAGSSSHCPPALLLCGDLNSDLNWGIPGAVGLISIWSTTVAI